jgi:hypothetical protein
MPGWPACERPGRSGRSSFFTPQGERLLKKPPHRMVGSTARRLRHEESLSDAGRGSEHPFPP